MKKLIFLLLAFFALILIDYVIPKIFPLTSKDNYLLGYENFHNSADETVGQERIILVGGSSLAWGVSSEILTNNLGILTLNSGIHAGVGYRNFFRNIEDVLDKDRDLIVISPEYSIISEGGYLGRSKQFCYISIYVKEKYPIDCIGYSISSLIQILPIRERINYLGVKDEYTRDGFNKFGDYIHRIDGVNMIGKTDTIEVCSGWNIEDLSEKYLPFINNLISEGYEIVYVPNFVPKLACSDKDKLYQFHRTIFEKYGIQSYNEAQLLFEEQYFYNSRYHLTDEGVNLKTSIFENQLRHYLINRQQ
jgi:hypothetical protein